MDLVSLRYPLVLAAFVQAALVFWLFPRRAPATALVAALAVNVLGLLEFLNPTAHWYCLSLVIAIAAALRWLPRGRGRLVTVGVLLGTLALFRLLSGAIVALGVLASLLAEAHADARGKEVALERGLLALAIAGLVLYLVRATGAAGWILFGVWPLLLFGWLWKHAAAPNRAVLRLLGPVVLGVVLASLPMWLYHLAHGSVRAWLHDLATLPVTGAALPFLRQQLYGWLFLSSLMQALSGGRGLLGTLYWSSLLLAAAANGLLVLRALRRRGPAEVPALSLLAVCYGLVSVHYQIPIYLHFSVGLSAVSLLLLLSGEQGRRGLWAASGLVALLSCFAVRFHAGQPLSRGLAGMLEGRRVVSAPSAPLPRSHLSIEPAERERYLQVIQLIQRETRPDEAILSIPGDAELYFLSARRNPFRFYNTALGLPDEAALLRTVAALLAAPPRLIVFAPSNKYNTVLSARLMETVRMRYALLQTMGEFEIYRLR